MKNGTTDSLARAYDAWHAAARPARNQASALSFFEWILGLASAKPGSRLLDVACGDGSFLAVAVQRGLEAHGIDLSAVAIGNARANVPKAKFLVGDGQDLSYDDSSFDVVTCLGSLEHFPSPERGAAEIARVLRPNGRAVVYVPNLFFLGHVWFGLRYGVQPSEGGQQFSETFRSSQGWAELLEESGLRVLRWEVWNKIHETEKVGRLTMFLWNTFERFLPRNGGYCFAFVCEKRG